MVVKSLVKFTFDRIIGTNKLFDESCCGTLNLVDLAGSERLKVSFYEHIWTKLKAAFYWHLTFIYKSIFRTQAAKD